MLGPISAEEADKAQHAIRLAATRGPLDVCFCAHANLRCALVSPVGAFALTFGSKSLVLGKNGIHERFLSLGDVYVPYAAVHSVHVGLTPFFQSEQHRVEHARLFPGPNKAANKSGFRVIEGGGETSPPKVPRLVLVQGGVPPNPSPWPPKLVALFAHWASNLRSSRHGR